MKRIFPILALIALGSCGAPADQEYCGSFGYPQGHAEYVKCIQYFHEQQALFSADRQVCELEADGTYPPSLYSRPTSYPVRVYSGIGRGYYGGFGHTEMVHVGADYQHNAQVDALRMRIIQPCMQRRGWVSGSSWQAGRMIKTPSTGGPATMPWLKK